MAEALLSLQDQAAADVPLLLAALFAGQRHGLWLDDAAAATWAELSRTWTDAVVRPLRSVRRALKAPADPFRGAATAALRDAVKGAELEAERLQLAALAGLLPAAGGPPSTAAAIANFRLVLDRLPGFRPDRDGPAAAVVTSAL